MSDPDSERERIREKRGEERKEENRKKTKGRVVLTGGLYKLFFSFLSRDNRQTTGQDTAGQVNRLTGLHLHPKYDSILSLSSTEAQEQEGAYPTGSTHLCNLLPLSIHGSFFLSLSFSPSRKASK